MVALLIQDVYNPRILWSLIGRVDWAFKAFFWWIRLVYQPTGKTWGLYADDVAQEGSDKKTFRDTVLL